LLDGLDLGGVTDVVGEDEEADAGAPVVRGDGGEVLGQEGDLGGAVAGVGTGPAQVVQVEERVGGAMLLEQVGDLRGDRAFTRPECPGEQDG
jgi:hypothetical protein